jgi:hypothetical protein
VSWILHGCKNCVFRQENGIFNSVPFLLEKMTEHDELFGKVRSLNKANMEYMRKLEAKVQELEQNATKHEKTVKKLERTVEDLIGYNKLWRDNWCERVMKNECPLFMEFYSGRMSPETFKKHFQSI